MALQIFKQSLGGGKYKTMFLDPSGASRDITDYSGDVAALPEFTGQVNTSAGNVGMAQAQKLFSDYDAEQARVAGQQAEQQMTRARNTLVGQYGLGQIPGFTSQYSDPNSLINQYAKAGKTSLTPEELAAVKGGQQAAFQFRPRGEGENMYSYLKAKQEAETAATGKSGIELGKSPAELALENAKLQARGTTAPTATQAGKLIRDPNELKTLKSTDIARTTGLNIYRRDLALEQSKISAYSKEFGAPKTDPEWRKFHDFVYEGKGAIKIASNLGAEVGDGGKSLAGGVGFTAPDLTSTKSDISFIDINTASIEQMKTNLQNTYNTQIQNAKDEAERLKQQITDLETKQTGTLDEMKTNSEPFRADLEKKERERLKIEENFFANQATTNEMEGLLTQIMADVKAAQGITGLAVIREPRIAAIKEDAQARIGILQSVMAARNNQISVAEGFIDRSVAALNADRQDKINYLNSVMKFYESQKDTKAGQLLQVNQDQKDAINSQTTLLQDEIEQREETAKVIKNLVLQGPEMASFLEKAGVKLNDSIDVIQQKMAAQQEKEPFGDTELDKLLTPTEAAKLKVPYGTTRREAANLGGAYKAGGGGGGGFIPTENKKLEQAGLLNADRQSQLDYLYGDKDIFTDTVEHLKSLRDTGKLNDFNYKEQINGLMEVGGYTEEQRGEVESLVNQAMEGNIPTSQETADDNNIASDFSVGSYEEQGLGTFGTDMPTYIKSLEETTEKINPVIQAGKILSSLGKKTKTYLTGK